jgi:hypothetical protein
LELDCNPVTEVLCGFNLGRLDLCMTSAEEKGNELVEEVESVNIVNVTFHLHKAEIKVYNRWITTDTVGVTLSGITGHVGRRQQIFEDHHRESVVSGFFGILTANLTFSMASLKSWFVVQELWINRARSISFPKAEEEEALLTQALSSPIQNVALGAPMPTSPKGRAASSRPNVRGHRKSSSTANTDWAGITKGGVPTSLRSINKPIHSRKSTAALQQDLFDQTPIMPLKQKEPSPPPEPESPREVEVVPKKPKNRVAVFIGVLLAMVDADADLGLVGNVRILLGGLAMRGLVPQEVPRPGVKSRIVFLEATLTGVELEFMGKLRGTVRLNSLSLVGERSENALLKNSLEVSVSPVAADLSYKVEKKNFCLFVCFKQK